MAPTNKSPTVTVCWEKIPILFWALWYALDITSPKSTNAIEGGIICPRVPVDATVVTMGLMSLPVLIQQGYKKDFSSGLVASTGTLGQIIPPSIALVLLGDVMSNAYQRAQNNMGIFSQQTVTVGDLFVGAIVPGIMICLGYLIYTIYQNYKNPNILFEPEANSASLKDIIKTLALPLLLIILVLGSIIAGIATPTEASAIGAAGALLIVLINGKLSLGFIK